jgi:hypothetical protein
VPGGADRTGSVLVFSGGASLSGTPAAHALLVASPAYLGQEDLRFELLEKDGQLADWNGDGILDFIAVASYATVGTTREAGAGFAWLGGPSLAGTVAADFTLDENVFARHEEWLGVSRGLSSYVVSTTTSAERVLLIGAGRDHALGIYDSGAIETFQVRGGWLRQSELAVPFATARDALGYH